MGIESSFVDQMSLGTENEEIDVFQPGEEYRAFGISRKAWGGEPFLNLVSKCGRQRGKPWSAIDEIEFDPSIGITISFMNHMVVIEGRRLDEIYEKLLSQRVVFIREADHASEKLAGEAQTVVTSITLTQRTNEIRAGHD